MREADKIVSRKTQNEMGVRSNLDTYWIFALYQGMDIIQVE